MIDNDNDKAHKLFYTNLQFTIKEDTNVQVGDYLTLTTSINNDYGKITKVRVTKIEYDNQMCSIVYNPVNVTIDGKCYGIEGRGVGKQ